MKSNIHLRRHLAILLTEYGKKNFLATLAQILNISGEELNALILEIEQQDLLKVKNTGQKEKIDPIEKIARLHPQKSELLRKLYARFQNKEFLVEAKDVKKFIETNSQSAVKVKSRSEAVTKVFKLLADLSSQELEELLIEKPGSEYSSLGTISDHILSSGREDK